MRERTRARATAAAQRGRGGTSLADAGLTVAGGPEPQDDAPDLPAIARDAVRTEGAAPAASARTVVEAWRFRAAHAPESVDLADVAGLTGDDANFLWVDLGGAAEADLRAAAASLGLPAGAVRAALAPWHRPRLVVYPAHFYASATVAEPEATPHRLRAEQLDLVVGPNLLVSIHRRPLPFAARLRARAAQSVELVALDAAFMLYLTLDELLAAYEELEVALQTDGARLEERALRDDTEAFLAELLELKRYAFALAQLAGQHREVLAAFLRPDFSWVAGAEVEGYFRDLEARLARLNDALAAGRDAVNGAFAMHVSHQAHRTNQVIKLLTMVSTVLLPATLIVAVFGANLAGSVSALPVATPAGFGLMVACIALVTLAILAAFRRRGWL